MTAYSYCLASQPLISPADEVQLQVISKGIRFLLLCNKLPQTQQLTTTSTYSAQFCRLRVQGELIWVLCSVYHKDEIKVAAEAVISSRARGPIQAHVVIGRIRLVSDQGPHYVAGCGPETIPSSQRPLQFLAMWLLPQALSHFISDFRKDLGPLRAHLIRSGPPG